MASQSHFIVNGYEFRFSFFCHPYHSKFHVKDFRGSVSQDVLLYNFTLIFSSFPVFRNYWNLSWSHSLIFQANRAQVYLNLLLNMNDGKGDCPGYWILARCKPAGEITHVPGLAVNISVSVRELRDGSWGKDGAWQTSIHYYTSDINCQLRMYSCAFIHSLFDVAAVALHIPSGIKQVSTFPSTYVWREITVYVLILLSGLVWKQHWIYSVIF